MTSTLANNDAGTNQASVVNDSAKVARYHVQLIKPADRERLSMLLSATVVHIIDSSEAVFQSSIDILGRGTATPPPPPKANPVSVDPKEAGTTLTGQTADDYTGTLEFLDKRIETMHGLDTSVVSSTLVVCSNGQQVRQSIIAIVELLKRDISALLVRTKPLTAAEKRAVITRIMNDIQATYKQVWNALQRNIEVADGGGDGRSGGQSNGGTSGGGGGDGGISGIIGSLVQTLPALAMMAATAAPDIIEALNGDKDKEHKDDHKSDENRTKDEAAKDPASQQQPAPAPSAAAPQPDPNAAPSNPTQAATAPTLADPNAQNVPLPAIPTLPGGTASRDRKDPQPVQPLPTNPDAAENPE